MSIAERRARSPYLEGGYAPIDHESTCDLEVVSGCVPPDLRGVFVRNGSNPRFEPIGRYHWFDGDGMIHAVHFDADGARYRNRWVRTSAFEEESEAGRSLWTGILERPDYSRLPEVFKDSANTDLVWFNGGLLALWWLGGEAYRIALPGLDTVGTEHFGGTLETHVAAHPKVDPVTGELIFMDFDPVPPYLTVGIVSPGGTVTKSESIAVGGPRLQHDLAFTADFVVVFDFPFTWETTDSTDATARLAFHRDRPSRFGLMPRSGTGADTRWFETDACFMYHVANAWQESGSDGPTGSNSGVVRLIGCEISDPLASDPHNAPGLPAAPEIAMLRLEPYLTEWTLHLDDGSVSKRRLNDDIAEFPKIDVRRAGRDHRFTYLMRFAPESTLLFDAVIRHDRSDDSTSVHVWPPGWFGGETVFCPRRSCSGEAEGYLVTFVVCEATGESEVHVLDAGHLEDEPVCRLAVPHRVPTGYHTWWVSEDELASGRYS